MKRKYSGIICAALLFSLYSCQSESERMAARIKEAENKIENDSTNMLNRPLAEEQLKAYSEFTDKFPDDPRSEHFLMSAGRLAYRLGKTPAALELYHRFYEKYPGSSDAPTALFLQGFMYDDILKNYEKAKELYTLFLSKYPNHQFAESAKFSLDNLGKSPDELFKMIEEKNKVLGDSANKISTVPAAQ